MPYYEANGTMTHWHHIVPRHIGGTNDPSNLIELTVSDHADAHKWLFIEEGRPEDAIAWLTLSGQITYAEACLEAKRIGGERKARCGEVNGRFDDHRSWVDLLGEELAQIRRDEMSARQSGQGNPMYGKERADLRQRNLTNNCQKNLVSREKNRLAHLGKRFRQQTTTCTNCGKSGGVGAIKRYHNNNCKTIL